MNERSLSELMSIDVVDRVTASMEISKVARKEESRYKVEDYLEMVSKNVVSFNTKFERVVRARLPNYWDIGGVLI